MLILSRRACDPYEYYATLNPTTSRKYRKILKKTFDVHCFMSPEELVTQLPSLVPATGHAWLLTDMSGAELESLKKRHRRKVAFARRAFAMPHKLEELTRVDNAPANSAP